MTEDNAPSLIDSNIIIYAYDKDELSKNPKASKLLGNAMKGKLNISLSTQNLSEFYFNVTKKIKNPISEKEAKEIITELLSFNNFELLKITGNTILNAIDISIKYKAPYWDSLIASTMQENSVFTIITENDKDFKKIPWLNVVNPF